jgi:uncharacterized delta-60 repeat protein
MKALWLGALFLCFLAVSLFSQPTADTLWTRIYGGSDEDEAFSVQQTADGGYVVAGYTWSFGAGGPDCYLVKTDPLGDTLWTRTYGGQGEDIAWSVQQTTDGGYIVAGRTNSFGTGSSDFYFVRTNAQGDTLWTRTCGGNGDDVARSVHQTSDGGYVAAGYTSSFGMGDWDFYVVKTDSLGDTLWTRTYGGSGDDRACSVQETADGGYVVGGTTGSFGAGDWDFYLVKMNSDGDTLWTRTYGRSGREWANSTQQTTDAGYIMAGWTQSSGAGTEDLYLVKTNSQGDTLWTRIHGGSNSDWANSVQQTDEGGYIAAGVTYSFGVGTPTYSNFWLVKTNPRGDTLWTRTYGGTGHDGAYSVQQTTDGGYVVAGRTQSFGASRYNFYLVKTRAESDYLVTICLNDFGSNAVLRWIAPETCDYDIYTTTQMTEIGNPPGPGWSVTATLTAVPAGIVQWTDPAGLVPYKRFAVTRSCP